MSSFWILLFLLNRNPFNNLNIQPITQLLQLLLQVQIQLRNSLVFLQQISSLKWTNLTDFYVRCWYIDRFALGRLLMHVSVNIVYNYKLHSNDNSAEWVEKNANRIHEKADKVLACMIKPRFG